MKEQPFTAVQIVGISATDLINRLTAIETAIKANAPQPTPPEKLISRTDTAQMLGVSVVTLHHWNKKGVLNAYKIGSQVRYKESEVLQALQAKKAQ